MGFNRQFRRKAQSGKSQGDFEDDLAFLNLVEKRSRERMAKTGEKPRRVLARVDHGNRDIRIFPVDPPNRPDGR
jgi:hypothetical protein